MSRHTEGRFDPFEAGEFGNLREFLSRPPRRVWVGLGFIAAAILVVQKQGRVRLYHLTLEGQEVTTAVVSPGQLFGLGAFLGGDGSATHAEAMEELHL